VGIAEATTGLTEVQAWPNPFSEGFDLRFDLARDASVVAVELRDATGRLVRTGHLGRRAAGTHQLRIDGQGLADGVYAWTLRADGAMRTGTLVHARD
jgi:flagellar hook assembly protein FlgD